MASARVNSRPAMSGTPSVVKNPGPIALNDALVLVSGPASKPCTRMLLLQLLPEMSATLDALTDATPGSAARASSTRSKNAIDCVGV